MATEIAKAYVQVVPTTRGISDALGKEMDEAGSASGSSFGGKFAKLAIAGIAAAGIGKTISAAVTQGADYEQAVGGIETLFKESSDTMIGYAKDAYKTCGLSANEYMQQSTSFAAALVSSCGGDTAKAAEAANTALQDMSDNANKMGTDMESLQFAYQGFAKQNYTMLDNLKLGYGGTKSEMERLLSDAEAIKLKQGEVADYSIDSYADIVEAIHVVQDEMGITGTTAQEAGTTISGSMSMVKGAWDNVLTAMASGEDMEQAIQGLITSVLGDGTELNRGFAGLLADMAGNVISAIPGLVQSIVAGFSGLLPYIVEVGSQALVSLINGFADALPTLIPQIVGIILQIDQVLVDNAPLLVETGLNLIQGLASGIINAVPVLIAALPKLISSILDFLVGSTEQIMQAGVELLTALVRALPVIISSIVSVLPQIISSIVTALMDMLPILIQCGIDLLVSLVQALPTIITSIVSVMPTIINAVVSALMDCLPMLIQCGIDLLVSLVDALPVIIESLCQAAPVIISGIVNGLLNNISLIIDAGITLLTSLVKELPTVIRILIGKMPEIIAAIVSGLSSGIGQIVEIGGNIIKGLWEGIQNFGQWIKDKIAGFCSNILGGIKDFFGIHSPSREMWWIGQMMVRGLAGSIEDNGDEAVQAAQKMAEGMDATMRGMAWSVPMQITAEGAISGGVKSAMLSSPYGSGSGSELVVGTDKLMRMISEASRGGGVTQNLTINAPQRLSAHEVARQTRLANRQLVLSLGGR